MSSAVDYLREHGPVTLDELPVAEITTRHRAAGVARFELSPTQHLDKGALGSGKLSPVFYLFGEHDEREIVAAWLDANDVDPSSIEAGDIDHRRIIELVGDQGPSFQEAARQLFDERLHS